ncbi:MAG: FKBP-type peptidyl-prolyl cis-trans isomerase [Bacteroidaceae bacterium]|nr:FKBP-type peptidyl-prolyl cis-trans isomerase [Bacteroidaceae bacterium]
MENKFVKVTYRMYTNSAASHKLIYDSEQPVEFVTGMGLMSTGFEERLNAMAPATNFDFTLQPADAFGERVEALVNALPRTAFMQRGKFADEYVFPGAEIPLMDKEGNHFMGTVVRLTDEDVIIDLNNPLAGKAIQFVGILHESREPSLKEMEQTSNILSGDNDCQGCGGGCSGGGCSGCGGGCK